MNEVGVEIVKSEESNETGIKYLNINVSDSEVERDPDVVRLCADAGIIEYAKTKTGHWIEVTNGRGGHECDVCHNYAPSFQNGDEYLSALCPNCGAKMEESEE